MADHHEEDDHYTTEQHEDDSLPFALVPETPRIQPLGHSNPKSAMLSPNFCEGSSHLSPDRGGVPALASSVISSPTDGESQSSSTEYGASSLLASSHLGSQYLDTAASLLQPNSSLLGGSSFQLQPRHKEGSTVWQTTDATLSPNLPQLQPPQPAQGSTADQSSSIAFSQLMHKADNAHEIPACAPTRPSVGRLPVLPEEEHSLIMSGDNNSMSLIMSSYHHLPDASAYPPSPDRNQNQPTGGWTHRNIFAGPQAPRMLSSAMMSGSSTMNMTQERRMASLAGATAVTTGADAFTVSVDIAAAATATTGRDVMDILGNPDLLKLWFDPVQALVITKASEGAQSYANRGLVAGNDREYEGEWIEATTPALILPGAGHVHRAGETVAFYMGFPATGRVTMFVERQRGRVGLTVGPFAGGVQVHHNLHIASGEDGKIRIHDEVKLRRDGDSHFCGLLDFLGKCYLPTIDAYVDQVLSSLARLRFLVEKGEHSVYVEAVGDTNCTPLL